MWILVFSTLAATQLGIQEIWAQYLRLTVDIADPGTNRLTKQKSTDVAALPTSELVEFEISLESGCCSKNIMKKADFVVLPHPTEPGKYYFADPMDDALLVNVVGYTKEKLPE